ncbi:MAG: 4-hydroxy-tetrahydrodipicolinate synthase [Deltaproteobacteria bacterium RBG_16_49_23]|nr:MAG: 4-hydroxy-tetrahydrodipicolinate synthase [Deltaproteobacteria bacterium RBG_16_49_23]
MNFQPKGIIPAMVTPITSEGKINVEALRKLTNYLIEGEVHGLFPVGSQGEFYALTFEEKKRIIEVVVDETRGRVPVYAGTGAITTREAIALTKMAEAAGVSAVSVLTPFFIHPNETELFEFYSAVAKSTRLPVLLYNNPGRTGINISANLVVQASKVENIVGIKDSSGDLTLTAEYIRKTGETFSVLAGRDTLIYGTLCYGGKGAIAATANVAPKVIVEIYEAFMAGDMKRSLEAQFRLAPLRLAFDLGTFPVVIKEALNLIGIDAGVGIPPVGGISSKAKEELREILKNMELLR